MNRFGFWTVAALLLSFFTAPATLLAQTVTALPPGSAPQQAAPSYSEAQLDQMVAPIALYPDPLLGQILMASTYPLEVVEASRWLQTSGNASLTGDQLAAALDQQPWDPSVKSLVAVPQVLRMMDSDLQWTEQLGDAFLAQQGPVMDSVQRLRQQAQATGALTSTPQQVVSTQGSAIAIEPENPDVVYVPVYNPMVVYGTWPYADYPPFYFPTPGYVLGAAVIGFGVGIIVADSLWGWDHWDWGHHRINIDDGRFSALNRGRPPVGGDVWQHDPDHRRGVPYRDAATRSRFQSGNSAETRRAFRGYGAATTPAAVTHTAFSGARPNMAATKANRVTTQAAVHNNASARTYSRPAAAPAQRAATPMFESFSRGSDVRAQSARGSMSRATMAPASAPRNNGGGGGRPAHTSNNGRR